MYNNINYTFFLLRKFPYIDKTSIEKQLNMPQLVPFYYVNEVVFAFGLIVVILYILSKYILPRIVRLFLSRMFIQKI